MNLNQITVPVSDVEKAIVFYQKLGLKLIVKALPNYARFECPDGDATFSLSQRATLPKGDGICVYFECEELDSYVSELQQKGIVFDTEPVDERWLWREAKLRDLDNNKIILYHAGENRKYPPWRVEEHTI
ncbi:MAG: VOC family protein [Flavobacteriaceae bacterium]|nr:VOC family protein [Flavobacteriaceae bacterium]